MPPPTFLSARICREGEVLDCKSWSHNGPYVLTTSNVLILLPLCDVPCHMEPFSVDLEFFLSQSAFILFCPVMAVILLVQVPDGAASSSAASIFGGMFNSTNCLLTPDLPVCRQSEGDPNLF